MLSPFVSKLMRPIEGGMNFAVYGESEQISKFVIGKGYDAVSYFTTGGPVKGSASFTYKWHGMTWYFSTKENRDLFAASPGKFASQYDGYCAWAMSEERRAHTDPEIWQIVDGKLYLNCSRSAHEKWSRDIPGNIRKADANWRKFSGGK